MHNGPVLCCSISPDGKRFISSGQDEHICIIDCESGEQICSLDEALDGQGLTVKYSFDGSRVQVWKGCFGCRTCPVLSVLKALSVP